MAAKQNSEKTRGKKYQERNSRRRIRRSIKKLKAEMEEIRAEVELIHQRQKHFEGKSIFQGDKAEMGRLCTDVKPTKKTGPDGTAAKRRELLKVGIKEIGSRKHQKWLHFKRFDKQLRKEDKTLQRIEAKAAQARAGTSSMREETAAMVEAMDDKKAELELLRLLHIHLFNEMVLLSETEEEGMEILLS
ncbi:hypothetical protein SLA2020_397150 [Shorea laevis]